MNNLLRDSFCMFPAEWMADNLGVCVNPLKKKIERTLDHKDL
jgi:hypothetical protein